jgi:hypothetical protein
MLCGAAGGALSGAGGGVLFVSGGGTLCLSAGGALSRFSPPGGDEREVASRIP